MTSAMTSATLSTASNKETEPKQSQTLANVKRGRTSISLSKLQLNLGNKTILDEVSADFHSGELCILLGPNGTGKSSLLKVLTQELPLQGQVQFFNFPVQEWPAAKLAKHLAMLPQASSLSFNFSVKEVVELGAIPLSCSQAEIDELVEYNMQQTDTQHLSQRLYPSLSGGEKQRVHLARVLTQLAQSGDKKILLLDEPTSALDLSHQHQTLSLAKELAKQGATVVIVMHDLNLAAQYADRMLILNQGKIVADGTPWQVLTKDTIKQVYNWNVQLITHPSGNYPLVV